MTYPQEMTSWLLILGCSIFLLSVMAQNANAIDKPAAGKQVEQSFTMTVDDEESSLSYWLYLPKDYGKEGKKFPLMLFLHGAGERGCQTEKVLIHGPPKLIKNGKDFPCIVISPQCPKEDCPKNIWWNHKIPTLIGLLDNIEENFKVDTSKEYVTGLSMGGFGTWKLTAAQPNRFAAVVPICGGGDPTTAKKLISTPIWTFHGDKDRAVPIQKSVEMVDAVREAGGKVGFSVYPGVAHDSWSETYDNPRVYEWMFSKSRPDANSKPE